MWKVEYKVTGKRNFKKYDVSFALFPTVGYYTSLFNHRSKHTIIFLWLFFSLEIMVKYK